MQFPAFTTVLLPFDPLIKFYFGIPFAGLVVFFAVYLGIVNNQSFSRYVRFNAMQAVLLDILLVYVLGGVCDVGGSRTLCMECVCSVYGMCV